MEKKMGSQMLLIVIGTVLGAIGTLFVQKLQENKIKKTLHTKVFEEIGYNSKTGTPMELTGNFKKFEVSAWENLRGTPAFYELPMDIRRPLDTYYLTLKWWNDGILKWKKLGEKEENEMKMEDLTELAKPYIRFLLEKKNLKIKNFVDTK